MFFLEIQTRQNKDGESTKKGALVKLLSTENKIRTIEKYLLLIFLYLYCLG